MKHTPGPWLFKGGSIQYGSTSRLVVFREGDRDIAHVIRQGADEIQGEENAHLIAAAPDLLEATGLLLALMQDGPAAEFLDEGKVMAMAAAAINKAKGVS